MVETGEVSEKQLLADARRGDESAFELLVDQHRGELHAHCYRMLGSVQDPEDAVQESLLGAWRALGSFEGRSSLRTWLYGVATYVCLRLSSRRPRRMLSSDHSPARSDTRDLGEPVTGPVWLEPWPGDLPAEEEADPASAYLRRESIELAALGPGGRRALVDAFVTVWERADVPALLDLLADDARFTMPPLPAWFEGREDVGRFLAQRVFVTPWRLVSIAAKGQPAFACYQYDGERFRLGAVNVLSLRGGRIAWIAGFVDPQVHRHFSVSLEFSPPDR